MSTTLIVVILLILLFVGLPQTGWHDYGYYPSGGIGLLVLILILYLLFRKT